MQSKGDLIIYALELHSLRLARRMIAPSSPLVLAPEGSIMPLNLIVGLSTETIIPSSIVREGHQGEYSK